MRDEGRESGHELVGRGASGGAWTAGQGGGMRSKEW